jgi:type I restriction enzyme M protein
MTRLRDVNLDPEASEDERFTLNNYLELIEKESGISKKMRETQKALDDKVTAKYSALDEGEVKTLVVDDKWLTALSADVKSELERISQGLTGRIKELAERYAKPLPILTDDVEILTGKVNEHLKNMGFV